MCAVVVPCSVGRKGSPLGITAAGFRGEDTCAPTLLTLTEDILDLEKSLNRDGQE